jgi:hypothetical protein
MRYKCSFINHNHSRSNPYCKYLAITIIVLFTGLFSPTGAAGNNSTDSNQALPLLLSTLPENVITELLTFFNPLRLDDAQRINGITRSYLQSNQMTNSTIMESNHALEATITRRYPQLEQLPLPPPVLFPPITNIYAMSIRRPLFRRQLLLLSLDIQSNTLAVGRMPSIFGAIPLRRLHTAEDTMRNHNNIDRAHFQNVNGLPTINHFDHNYSFDTELQKITYTPMADEFTPIKHAPIISHFREIQGDEEEAHFVWMQNSAHAVDFIPSSLIVDRAMLRRMIRRLKWIMYDFVIEDSPIYRNDKWGGDRDFPPPPPLIGGS